MPNSSVRPWQAQVARRAPLIALVAVLAVAFFLRVHRLATVPFGWHPDEAVYALYARDILAGKGFPIFFASYTGREVMYSYLEAITFALLGQSMLAGRLVSAFIGVFTVVGAYAVGRQWFSRRTGLFAAAFLALSLWHVISSRNGYRAVIQPLIQWPVLCFLFRGLRTEPGTGWRSGWNFIAAGLFLGLTQYTYTASRFFPALIVAILVLGLIFAREEVGRHGRSLVLMGAVALVVFAPLGIYFIGHPDVLLNRASQLSVFSPQWSGGDPWGRLWQSVRDTLGMFTFRGDPNFRFNLADRPVFGPVDGALFYAGVLVCVGRSVAARGLRRLAHLSLLAWLTIMLLPMTLSAEGLPYYLRAMGVLPAVYLFPALALDVAWGWIGRRRVAAGLVGVAIVALFGLLAARTYREYFREWDPVPRNDDDRRVAMVYVADHLRQTGTSGDLYISTEYAEHPTLSFLSGLTPEQWSAIHWFDARQSLPLPARGIPATYLFLAETPAEPMLMSRASGLQRSEAVADRFGRPVFAVYRWAGNAWPAPAQQTALWSWEVRFEAGDPRQMRHAIGLPADFGGTLSFLGYDRPDEVAAGTALPLLLYWETRLPPDRPLSIFAHLLDAESRIVGEYDANRYPTRFWRSTGGELLLSYQPLHVRPDTQPGVYQLEIGVYHPPTGQRLPIQDGGQMVADRLLLAPVAVR